MIASSEAALRTSLESAIGIQLEIEMGAGSPEAKNALKWVTPPKPDLIFGLPAFPFSAEAH
jgi:hypothetical protein